MAGECLRRDMTIPVTMSADVAVVGAGPTGVPAALAAARAGARTLLIEQHGWLGGQVNQEMPFIGFLDGKGRRIIRGIGDEIVQELVKTGGSPGHLADEHEISFTPVDARWYNIVCLRLLKEAGVQLLLGCIFTDVEVESSRITHAVVANKSGLQAISAKAFVDATGDADVAARAGAPFRKGRQTDGKMMPALLLLTFYQVDWEAFRVALLEKPKRYDMDPDTPGVSGRGMRPEYFQTVRHINFWGFRNLVQEAEKHGYKPGNSRIGVFCPGRSDQGVYASLRLDGVDGTDAFEISRAESELRLMIPDAVRFIHDWIPGWEQAVLVNASPILGIQDTRVIEGECTLAEQDLMGSRRFDDVVAVGCAKIDDWDTYAMRYPPDSYDVPYRCLVPQNVDNLLVGGRAISADRPAMMSVRCMSMCTATGQAAGAAAFLCAAENTTNRELDCSRLQALLLQQGAYLGEERVGC